MRNNKKVEIEKSIIELEQELLNENITLNECEKESIRKHLNSEVSPNKLISVLLENSKNEGGK